jgi:cbb3-type cytochrome oxidase subunit 3
MRQLLLGGDTSAYGGFGAALTVVFFGVFAYWTWWAFRPANRETIEAAARLPFEGGE